MKTFIFLLGIFLPLVFAKPDQFFRKDYTYDGQFDAFYKLHSNSQGLSWNSAFLACDDEGATLFYPKEDNEWKLIKKLPGAVDGNHNVTDILIGLHDKFGLGEFITVDGHPTKCPLNVQEPEASHRFPSGYCVFLNIYKGSYRVGPCVTHEESQQTKPREGFVCKKVKNTTETCPTIDRDYRYVKSSRKCYKVNLKLKTWFNAMRTCHMEGGLLAVIQNEDEASLFRGLLGPDIATYHVGTYRIADGDKFYTVKGQDSDRMYQRSLNENEQHGENCGAIYKNNNNGYLYTITTDCLSMHPFICEMEINL